MSAERGRAYTVLISLTIAEIFLFGPSISTLGVFFNPLIRQFGWSHAQVSELASSCELLLGLVSVLAGYLLDRFDAGLIVAAGAALAGSGFVAAARCSSLSAMVLCYAMIGAGTALATHVPMAVVAANWFSHRFALAIGILTAGMSLGLAMAPRLATGVVLHAGWRVAMTTVGLPMLFVAAPIGLFLVRSTPAGFRVWPDSFGRRAAHPSSTQAGSIPNAALPGLEVGAALRTFSFWLLVAVNYFYMAGVGAVYFHTIPYLISVGYAATTAAAIFGAKAFLLGPGSILMGAVSDRCGTKPTLLVGFILIAGGVIALLMARHLSFGIAPVVAYVLLWGIFMGTNVVLPVMLAQSQGRRSYGTLMGIVTLAGSFGQGCGPYAVGKLLDLSHSYVLGFELAAGAFVFSGLLGMLVFPAAGHDRIPAPAWTGLAVGEGRIGSV
ncbi:MAG TPA: MFS transporter [Candidatus Binataceae bacterium]|nr:MFS transporter [Candidatus Binataceae bacterium]